MGAVSADSRTGDFGTAYGITADTAILVPKYSMSLHVRKSAFVDAPVIVEYAMARFLYAMPFLFLTSTYEVVGSALRGMGRSTLPAIFTVLGTVVFRVFWIYAVFPLWNSFQALIIIYPVSWVLTGGMMILYYFWQRGKLFGKDSERPALVG